MMAQAALSFLLEFINQNVTSAEDTSWVHKTSCD